ncbi:MAG: hypothetical protein KDN19_03580 [Verrucomicrobiae bacterium]|nr:hypothetical protein [Verrucomicrobiae bacterium]
MNSPTAGTFELVCEVTDDDIEAMLDAYDSGMCDTSTANCLSTALTRQLGRSSTIALIRYDSDRAHFRVGNRKLPVPGAVLNWLSLAEVGARRGGITFSIEIPVDLGATSKYRTPFPLWPVAVR